MRKNLIWIAGCVLLACMLVACITKNLERQKQMAEKTRLLGEAYFAEQRHQDALREFLKAEEMYSNDHLLHDDLGRVYLALGRHELAIKHFKKALQINPEYTPARNNLGNAYAVTKDWDKAIEQYEIAADSLLYATPHYPLANIGFVYYQQGKYDLAKNYYRKSLKAKRDYVGAMHGLGRTYMATGRVAEAIDIMEKAVGLAPESAFVNFDMGNAYRMNREYQKAVAFYNKAAELQPDSELADKALEEARKIENLQ
jgi:tetratricopeptide (TPR) repeat protein